MGLFNEIVVSCPDCGGDVIFQSKSGSCTLATHDITHMPIEDFAGILGDTVRCKNCDALVAIDDEVYVTPRFVNMESTVCVI